MTTTENVQQVKVNLVTQAQYSSMIKNNNEFYVITDEEYADADKIPAVQTLQDISTVTDMINLIDNTSLYKLTPTAATTLTFTNNTSADATTAYTFELCIDMSTVYTITFPSNVTWQDGETPDLSETGIYFLAFRTIDGGSTWLGNLQGRW